MDTLAAPVVVVGSANMDFILRVERLPGAGETVRGASLLRLPGGKGANQAVAAARAGGVTHFIGMVGDDREGEELRLDLARERVDITSLRTTTTTATGAAIVLVDEHAGENAIAVALGANASLTRHTVATELGRIKTSGMVVVAGHEIPEEAVLAAARFSSMAGATFVLNPAPARPIPLELAACCDVITPNEREIEQLGYTGPEALLAAGAKAIVVTLGSAGARIYRRDADPVHQPAFPAEVVDTTGAGDAFAGVLAVALAEGIALEGAVRWAAAAAALSTEGPGGRSLPWRNAIEDALANDGHADEL
jgi:ribokinase